MKLRSVFCILYLLSLTTSYEPSLAESSSKEPSLYESKSKWRNTSNESVSSSIAKGDFVAITMIYTSCAHACPLMISKLQELDRAISKAGIAPIKYVLASFDSKADRPENLKKYQLKMKLDEKSWHFLAAESEADARELAVILGINFKDVGKGDFSHNNIITLLNKNGQKIASIDKLSAPIDDLVEALKKASAAELPTK